MPTLKARIGGAWVDVGGSGGASEVEIGPDDPIGTNSSAELWYDTDAVAPLNSDMRWYTAWGVIAVGTPQTTSVANPGTNIPITPALTFQTVAGRRYRATMRVASATFTAGAPTGVAVTIRSGTSGGTMLGDTDQWFYVSGSYAGSTCQVYFTGDGTSKTAQGITETVSVSGTTVSLGVAPMIIEDVGPSSGTNVAPAEADLRWFSAWGEIAVSGASDIDVTAGPTTVVSLPFTAVAGRRYTIALSTAAAYWGAGAAGNTYQASIQVDGSVVSNLPYTIDVVGGYIDPGTTTVDTTPAAGAHTVSIVVSRVSGTGTMRARFSFVINDVGPVTGAAIIPQVAVTQWTALGPLMANGWVSYAAPYGPAQYRKVGDEVQLRGLIQSGSPPSSTMFTLPVGYRPQHQLIFTQACSAGTAEVRVDTPGTVACPSAYPATAAPAVWTSLSGIQFSVTP